MDTMHPPSRSPVEMVRTAVPPVTHTLGVKQESTNPIKVETKDLGLFYGKFQAIGDVNMSLQANKVTAIIGPSGCGKSTVLRCFNRMNDLVPNTRVIGQALLDGKDVYGPGVDVVDVRRQIGMVFQRPNPFPKSIYDNIAYGPRLYGVSQRAMLDEIVEKSLQHAALWDEVKDKLRQSA